jgi:hypothetical protein
MSNNLKLARQSRDHDMIRLNGVGLSLATIGKTLDVHPTTVTLRLSAHQIPPADTRRAFMEDVYNRLNPIQRSWLEQQVGAHVSIKDLVTNLLVEKFLNTSGVTVPYASQSASN